MSCLKCGCTYGFRGAHYHGCPELQSTGTVEVNRLFVLDSSSADAKPVAWLVGEDGEYGAWPTEVEARNNGGNYPFPVYRHPPNTALLRQAREALKRAESDWVHPYDGKPYEDGEMPGLDMVRAAIAAIDAELAAQGDGQEKAA